MKLLSDPVEVLRLNGSPLHPNYWGFDPHVVLEGGDIVMALNYPGGNPVRTAIAMCSSPVTDGIRFTAPRTVLRPMSPLPTAGVETPCPLGPGPSFPVWSMTTMLYPHQPESTDHVSAVALALAQHWKMPWTWYGPVLGASCLRQVPNVVKVPPDPLQPVGTTTTGATIVPPTKGGISKGGLSEMATMWQGGNMVGVFATNSYRPKPCLFVAVSQAGPWLGRSWTPSPDPVLEGEGALWASQGHLSMVSGRPLCVYAEGPPERIRVAWGEPDLSKFTPAEILLEPESGTLWSGRCVGPSWVPLGGNRGRLYFNAVEEEGNASRVMTVEMELE